jgi:EAL domain-containing protein (putative c-di-GMP-specific phosphodiesterase class I)
VLHDTGLDPAFLELEVTESAVMDDPEVALEQLHRLRELGLRLAIDDFGTGYSSLLRLKRLPVQKLKIDQGFVAGLPWDEDDAAIVRVIIALAKHGHAGAGRRHRAGRAGAIPVGPGVRSGPGILVRATDAGH